MAWPVRSYTGDAWRLCYFLFPEIDWGFVFVDDFCWIVRAENAQWLTPRVLGFLLAVGAPFSWKKMALSEINTWLGFGQRQTFNNSLIVERAG